MRKRAEVNVARISALVVAAFLMLATVGCASHGRASAGDESAIREALQAYVNAWLSNDADAVMSTLTDDIVLQPHHGVEPVIGSEAVRSWWFPEGPPTVVTRFTLDVRAVTIADSLAYAWGRSAVAWDYEGKSYSNEGNALSVLKKGRDGEWRIAHQIWNDPPNQVQ